MVGYDSGFPGDFVAGVKRGVWVGFSFTVLGSDGLMLVFLGLAGLLWSPFVARVFYPPYCPPMAITVDFNY